MISKTRQLLLGSLLAGAALAASAQQAPAPSAADKPAASASTQRMERGDRAKRFEQMQQRRTQRLAALKEKLKLDAAQESAWNSFAAAQQPQPPQRPAQRPSRQDIAKLTTPQRLDLMQKRQAERSAAFAQRADATRSFYAALKPEQQQTFDAETMRFAEHGPRHPQHGEHGPARS